MSKKQKQKSKAKTPASRQSDVDAKDRLLAETRSADAATVAWTLCAMGTLLALAFRWLVQLIIAAAPDAKSLPPATPYLPPLMLFTALVTGILAISATPFVYWLRRAAPPWPITAGIIAIGLAPFVILLLQR